MMKFTKLEMSVNTKNTVFNIIGGITWIAACLLFTDKYKYLHIIGAIALIISGIILAYEVISEYLIKEDEMYITHMKEAKAAALDRLVWGLMVFFLLATIFSHFKNINNSHDWRAFAFIVVGLSKLITGMYFRNLERKGRYY